MSIIQAVWNTVVKFINWILEHAYMLLPSSPFKKYITAITDSDYLGYINYFIPIDTFIVIGEAWLVAIGIYILYSVILKWAKVVDT